MTLQLVSEYFSVKINCTCTNLSIARPPFFSIAIAGNGVFSFTIVYTFSCAFCDSTITLGCTFTPGGPCFPLSLYWRSCNTEYILYLHYNQLQKYHFFKYINTLKLFSNMQKSFCIKFRHHLLYLHCTHDRTL